ncbi:MAG: SDR family oxidoreductase [Gammaproteobacteria bacterium]|nr:SDR family oxidoreductase [Gammaproteobacteria bacterium]
MPGTRTVVLTGATGGIGRQIAERLAATADTRLLLIDRNAQALTGVGEFLASAPAAVETIVADLSIDEGRKAVRTNLMAAGTGLDLLINCAGINNFGMFAEATPETIQTMIEVNVTAPMLLTHMLLPYMLHGRPAQIVNFGSTFGAIGYPGFATYSATKFAMHGFSQALRRELRGTEVKVCYIAPRATRTALNSGPVVEMNAALGVAMDPPEFVADQVMAAVRRRDNSDRYLGWPEKLFVRINALLPGIVDQALGRQLKTIRHFASAATSLR